MTDIGLFWDNENGWADFAVAAGDLVADNGLRTGVLMSFFLKGRARDDDELPDPNGDRGGWWGDSYAEVEGDQIGSRLWLFKRRALLPDLINDFKEAAEDCLAWMVDDGIAQSVTILVTRYSLDQLRLQGEIQRPTGDPYKFDFLWSNV